MGVVVALAVGVTLLLLGNGLTIFILLSAGRTPAAAEASSPRQPVPPKVPDQPEGTPGSPTGTPAALGDTVVLAGEPGDGRRIAVTAAKLISPVTPQSMFLVPKPGHRLVAVSLTIVNQGGETYQEWPGEHADLIDDAGESHRAMRPGGEGDVREGQVFQLATLNPGGRQTGLVVFEIPQVAAPITFRYGFSKSTSTEIHARWALP